MSSRLSAIPTAKRRHLAGAMGLFATLFVAVGAVSATGPGTAAMRSFMVVAFLVGVGLAIFAWGIALTIRADRAEDHLDSAVEAAVVAGGASMGCGTNGCGHDHDPDELVVTDADCAADGHGVTCSHDCATCVLATAGATGGTRPSPSPAARRPLPR